MRNALITLTLGLVLFVSAAQSALSEGAGKVTVFAASSLKDVLEEIAADWQSQSGHEVALVLAGSSALARQIQQGAPADIFLSANEEWMDVLEHDGLLVAGTRGVLVTNTLVLITGDPDIQAVDLEAAPDLPKLLGSGKLAMAQLDTVPAGIYGKEALMSLGLWEDVAPNVAQARNVRAALAFVSTREAPLGIVYATDAAADENVRVLGTFPASSHAPIVYPVAAIAPDEGLTTAEFLSFLRGEEARAVFIRHGFEPAR